jgi:hypothetical protein
LAAHTIDIRENIKDPVVVPDAWSPNTAAINISTFQAEGGTKVKTLHAIAGQFPVHEVFGVHYYECGVHVHRGAGEVVVFAYPDDIGILELLVKQGI